MIEQLFTQLEDPSCGSSDLPFSDAHTQEWANGMHLESEGTILLDAVFGTEELFTEHYVEQAHGD